ncbi:MAG: SDR family NAD(P)-dependent oxidoreductase, partial [Ilumatobacteraceae bacterium]
MLVTGGARGLGAAIARRAMTDGYRVAVIDTCVDNAPDGCATYPIS